MSTFSNIFSSETTVPIEAKFHMEPPRDGGTNMTKDCSTWPRWPPFPYMVKTLKNLLLPNQKTDDLETWYIASGAQLLHSSFKWWPSHTHKKIFFCVLPRNTPCTKNIFSRRKIKTTYFMEGVVCEILLRNSASFHRETPQNLAMGRYGPKVSSCRQWGLWSDGETEWMPRLIWVSTRGVIKPTQNRYVLSIITGCAAIGEEQCTCKCNFLF